MKTIKVRPVLIKNKEKSCKEDLVINTIGELGIHIVDTEPSFHNKQELIFISLEDGIKEGDLFTDFLQIHKCTGVSILENTMDDNNIWLNIENKHYPAGVNKFGHYKIISLQPQIPEPYIQQFIEEYNKGGVKDVEIEMELIGHSVTLNIYNYEPKLTNGFVTIVNKNDREIDVDTDTSGEFIPYSEPILYTEE